MGIIPTLLTTTIDEFISQMNIFPHYYSRLQLDIADGKLVPNKTTQIEEMIDVFSKKTIEINQNIEFDFHLMVQGFKEELNKIKELQNLGMNVNVALINAELHPDIDILKKDYSFSIGLDVSPQTQIESITQQYNLNIIESIQIMTVNPGFQGSPFLEKMLLKIEQLRMLNYKMPIMIDGGVNHVTIPLIKSKKFTPDFLCIGSYLTKAGDTLEERVQELNNI